MKIREEFEAACRQHAIDAGFPEYDYGFQRSSEDGNCYEDSHTQAAWWAWQASRLPSGVVAATAWRVIDAKGKRYTVYNKDLAMAISDAGLSVAPMCDVPPEGWECSRERGHSGPCAASETNHDH